MKISRVLIVIVAIIVIAIVGLYAYETLFISTPSKWNSAAQYPLSVGGSYGTGGQACVNSSAYIYCIGGEDLNNAPRNTVYSSNPLSPSSVDISSWTTDSSVYPQDIFGQSCVVFSGSVYCVGGINDDALDNTASSYFASLSNGIVGPWNSTTPYPIPVDTQSCVTSSAYIYCVAGNNQTAGSTTAATNSTSAWYAPISNSGIGKWALTKSYPDIFYPICYTALGNIYCIGGVNPNDTPSNSVYYASLSSSGVGSWTQTTAYPVAASGESCVIVSSTIYCVGGEVNSNTYVNSVYYASVSSSGIGAWNKGSFYPDGVTTSCSLISGIMYCVAGFDASSSGYTSEVNYLSLIDVAGTSTTT